MMTDYISYFFITLNIVVVLAALVYAVRTYVLPGLRNGFEQQKNEEKKLHTQTVDLRKQKQAYSAELKKEERDVARLQQTIDQWAQRQKRTQHEQRERYSTYQVALEKKIYTRMSNHYYKKQEHAIAQKALYDVRTTLQKKFEDIAAQSAYTQRILDDIAKRLL